MSRACKVICGPVDAAIEFRRQCGGWKWDREPVSTLPRDTATSFCSNALCRRLSSTTLAWGGPDSLQTTHTSQGTSQSTARRHPNATLGLRAFGALSTLQISYQTADAPMTVQSASQGAAQAGHLAVAKAAEAFDASFHAGSQVWVPVEQPTKRGGDDGPPTKRRPVQWRRAVVQVRAPPPLPAPTSLLTAPARACAFVHVDWQLCSSAARPAGGCRPASAPPRRQPPHNRLAGHAGGAHRRWRRPAAGCSHRGGAGAAGAARRRLLPAGALRGLIGASGQCQRLAWLGLVPLDLLTPALPLASLLLAPCGRPPSSVHRPFCLPSHTPRTSGTTPWTTWSSLTSFTSQGELRGCAGLCWAWLRGRPRGCLQGGWLAGPESEHRWRAAR